MTDTLILMAALVVAIVWVIFQQRKLTSTMWQLEQSKEIIAAAEAALESADAAVQAGEQHNMFLKNVLLDVAKGEADVWIEDGEVRAARKATGETPIH